MPYPIKIILVDDHDLVRESFRMLLEKDERFSIISHCKSGAEAIDVSKKLLPDVMLMDINMSPINGFEAAQTITKTTPSIKIIGMSINNNPKYALKMLDHGANGFVTKTSSFSELAHAIEKVYAGEKYICDEVKKKMPATEE
jgi:two-component system, NarL family, invasion response regulator UvrY